MGAIAGQLGQSFYQSLLKVTARVPLLDRMMTCWTKDGKELKYD